MTESEFLALAERTLDAIENQLERAADDGDLDIECSRSGNVLEIECLDSRSKIVVNSQAPMQQLWVAAKAGGFHYKHEAGKWIDTRDGSELFAALARMIGAQAGGSVALKSE